jgi:hypothetical protein
MEGLHLMSATHTPTGKAADQPPEHESTQRRPVPSPPRPNTQTSGMRAEDEFLSRFGDVIDDRIAETLDELLDERSARQSSRRLPYVLATLSLMAAFAASVLLRQSAPAAWAICSLTATACLVIAWATRITRS